MHFRSLGIALSLAVAGAATPAAGEVRIALIPIEVHAAGDDVAYLQAGLGDMIAARLDQYQGVDSMRAASEPVAAGDREAAREIGRELGAAFVVYGSFTQFGAGASLDIRCARVEVEEGEEADATRRVFVQSGTLTEIIPQLDTLAQKLARYAVRGSGAKPQLAGAEPETPPAASAPQGLSEAERKEILDRIEALERAVYAPLAAGETPGDPTTAAGETSVVR